MGRTRATTDPTVPTQSVPTPDESAPIRPNARIGMATPTKESPNEYVLEFTGLTEIAAGIVEKYATADAKEKAKIRKSVSDLMFAAMSEYDAVRARAYQIIAGMLTTSAAKSAEKVDPNLIIATRIMTLRRAAELLMVGTVVPDGIDRADVSAESIMAHINVLGGADPSDDMIKSAEKIATAKITRSGTRNDITEYITRAFADVPTGQFLTVSQIIVRGAESGNDYRPSSGAVSAALNAVLAGKRVIDGIAPETRGALGAVATD